VEGGRKKRGRNEENLVLKRMNLLLGNREAPQGRYNTESHLTNRYSRKRG